MEGEIELDGRRVTLPLGLRRVDELQALAGANAPLFLERAGQEATPLAPFDHILLRGGERLTTTAVSGGDTAPLATPVRVTFNEQAVELAQGKATGLGLKENDAEFPHGRLFVESVGDVDVEVLDDMTVVVREADVYFVVPPSEEGGDDIDLEECGKHGRRPPRGHSYRVRVDGAKYTVGTATTTRADVLALVGKSAQDWSLNQKLRGGRRVRIEPEDVIDLCKPGVERFETVRRQAQQGHG